MTPRRKPPILRENDRDSSVAYNGIGGQQNTGPVMRRGLARRIKNLFRKAMKAVTSRSEPAAQATTRSRRTRTGAISRTFRLASRSLLRPVARLPVISQAATLLHDTLAWLHLWDWNENVSDHEACGDTGSREENHLSPRL